MSHIASHFSPLSFDEVETSMSSTHRVDVMGTAVDALSWEQAINSLSTWGQHRMSTVVCNCNVHMTVTAQDDPLLREALNAADMVTADGAPVAWAMRRAGYPTQDRINGPDLTWRYLAHAEAKGQVVSFYGASQDTLDKLQARIQETFPNLQLGAMISPPFRSLTPEEDQAYVDQINRAGTNVLFVGLGCPKQEIWMHLHRGRVRAAMVGVGAAFDYHAGTVQRAPLWMQQRGLEWFYRLMVEPRRLWQRYFHTNPRFLLGMALRGFKGKRLR